MLWIKHRYSIPPKYLWHSSKISNQDGNTCAMLICQYLNDKVPKGLSHSARLSNKKKILVP